jgi:hypothetical protein
MPELIPDEARSGAARQIVDVARSRIDDVLGSRDVDDTFARLLEKLDGRLLVSREVAARRDQPRLDEGAEQAGLDK